MDQIEVPAGLPFGVLIILFAVFSFALAKGQAAKWYVSWVLVSGFIHFFIEGGYAFWNASVDAEMMKRVDHHTVSSMFLFSNVPLSTVLGLEYWRDVAAVQMYALYAKFDLRYGQSDPVVITIGWMEIFLHGPLSIWTAYAFIRNRPLKHLANIVLTIVQITGTIVYFFHPIFSREKLFTDNTWDLYVWVYFLNGLWILLPGIALAVSCREVSKVLFAAYDAKAAAMKKNGNKKLK
jgi:cholestenol delta-isomerase